MTAPQTTPPKFDEIEVSLFGPGYGESIVIHVGQDRWLIVDCCVDPFTKIPKPLQYLGSLGVEPRDSVEMVVASHWHDDHVRGISRLLESCSSAVFCCAKALTSKEFLALANLFETLPAGMPPGSSELLAAITLAADRSKSQRRQALRFAHVDKLLWRNADATLVALSPSDEMDRRCLAIIAEQFAAAKRGAPQRLVADRPNNVAVVLRLDTGTRSILLGSDLEESGDPLVGWTAAIACLSASAAKSSVFKVAHHGSESGHHDRVWSELLQPEPNAFLTPFRHGGHRLPKPADRSRILSLTGSAYISANPEIDVAPKAKRVPKVESLIRASTRNRRHAVGPVGHIRWRASASDPADPGTVTLFDGAMQLSAV